VARSKSHYGSTIPCVEVRSRIETAVNFNLVRNLHRPTEVDQNRIYVYLSLDTRLRIPLQRVLELHLLTELEHNVAGGNRRRITGSSRGHSTGPAQQVSLSGV